MAYQVEKTDEEWRAELTPEEYDVLRRAGTERAFKGKLTDTETWASTGARRARPSSSSRTPVPLGLRLAVVLPAH